MKLYFRDQDVLQAKRERAEQMKQDRIDDRRNYCERKEAFRKKQEQVRLWECVNRFKTNNVIEEYNDNCEKERWAKILNYRAELQAQTVLECYLLIEIEIKCNLF